jgi:hypothetical protein
MTIRRILAGFVAAAGTCAVVHAESSSPAAAPSVPVVDGVVQPRRPLPDAIRDAIAFFKKSDGGYVPGKLDGPLAAYFRTAHVQPDGSPSDRKFCFPARQHAYFINTFLL